MVPGARLRQLRLRRRFAQTPSDVRGTGCCRRHKSARVSRTRIGGVPPQSQCSGPQHRSNVSIWRGHSCQELGGSHVALVPITIGRIFPPGSSGRCGQRFWVVLRKSYSGRSSLEWSALELSGANSRPTPSLQIPCQQIPLCMYASPFPAWLVLRLEHGARRHSVPSWASSAEAPGRVVEVGSTCRLFGKQGFQLLYLGSEGLHVLAT